MHNNFYVSFYTVIKKRDEKQEEEELDIINNYLYFNTTPNYDRKKRSM